MLKAVRFKLKLIFIYNRCGEVKKIIIYVGFILNETSPVIMNDTGNRIFNSFFFVLP